MRTLLAMLVTTALTACFDDDGPTSTWTEYQNRNNGRDGKLTFPMLEARSVGEMVEVEVTRGEVGQFECGTHQSFFGSEMTSCELSEPVSPVAQILEARCDGVGCVAAIAGTRVRLTGQQPGPLTLSVEVKLADGTVLEDATAIDFARVDTVELQCTEPYRCPGPHAVFTGASFRLYAYPSSATLGRLTGPFAVAGVEPAGIVAARVVDDISWGRLLQLDALSAGEARVRLARINHHQAKHRVPSGR